MASAVLAGVWSPVVASLGQVEKGTFIACEGRQSLSLSSSFKGLSLTHVADRRPGSCVFRREASIGVRAAVATAPPKLSQVVKWEAGKRLQTQVLPVGENTTTIRSLDWDRDRFDIEFGLQNGTTYNSYVIQGDRTAVIDASHEKFRELYLAALRGEVDPSTIDYVVANHTEPDHSGLIPDILALAPNAVVLGSRVCIQFLQNLVLTPFKSQVVKAGDTIDLGKGHVLEFVMAPNLHWPDTMFTLDRGSGIMYTCDAFGMHYCSEDVFDEELTTLEDHFRFYYDCLMRPNARSVLGALKKISSWQYDTIAVGHGPMLRRNVTELMGRYEAWSKSALEKQSATIALLYVSDYGFSDRLSQAMARGITKTTAGAEMIDLNTVETQELVEAVGRSAAVVLMVPPHTGPAAAAATTLFAAVKSKQPVLVAESYGGDDEPVDTLMARFADMGVPSPLPPLRVKATPTEATYQEFEEAGTDLGQLLTKKKAMEDRRSGMPVGIAKAIARVSGGLYIVTAAKGASKSAMVSSAVGDTFVLNCLDESTYGPVMKHFLKRFPPGADRFEGVEWSPATCGAPILNDALAFMECKVVSRMETNDHWITYAHVNDGNVSKPEGRTAAHHRKLGDYY
eukprot:jgi/Mesen1/5379/ME000268S04584